MAKILENTTASPISVADVGVTLAASSTYTIPPQDYLLWAASSDILSPVGLGDVVVNDGTFDLTPSDGIGLLKGIYPSNYPGTPSIQNIAVAAADTEYAVSLPIGLKEMYVRSRKDGILRIAFSAGQTATNYVIVYPGDTYTRKNIRRDSTLTIYYRSSKSSDTLEVEYWT